MKALYVRRNVVAVRLVGERWYLSIFPDRHGVSVFLSDARQNIVKLIPAVGGAK